MEQCVLFLSEFIVTYSHTHNNKSSLSHFPIRFELRRDICRVISKYLSDI